MTNKIFTLLTGCIFAFTLASCDSLFRDAPVDKLSENEIWSDAKFLDEYTTKWYRQMDNGFYILVSTVVKNLGQEFDPWYGDQITVGRSDWYQSGYGEMLKGGLQIYNSRGKLNWQDCYTTIASINKLLEHQSEIPADVRKRLLGEAHFFRAYTYYKLLRMYGGSLIIDHTFNPLQKVEKFPRASYEEMVKYVSLEASRAAILLEETYPDSQAGRVTRGAALMLKGKVFFWAAGTHYQNADKPWLGFPTDRSAEMLDSAALNYDRVMALHRYDLIRIPGSDKESVVKGYREIFLTKNSCESILEVQHSDDGDFMYHFGHKLDRDAAPPSATGTNCAYCPTQNHVDEYRMANGKYIGEQGSGYDPKDPWTGRDYRFYANVLYDGAEWKGRQLEINYRNDGTRNVPGRDLTPYDSSTTSSVTRTGYYMAKFLRESQTIDQNETYASSQNYIIWRYAELLLDYAEIDFLKGRSGDALAKVNEIRARVHMPALTSVTWDDILNERRVELAFEKTTYWDLLRYGTAEQKMSGATNPLYGCRVVYDINGNKTITLDRVINGRNNDTRLFLRRQYFLPIAWDDIRYHGIEQNPDWIEG